jgi:PIN domain nuclease of toxin-antitoxin system
VRLLLDTCTFLWVVTGDAALSAEARGLFVDPGNEVFLSAVSCWEIALKHRLGRLPLPGRPDRLVPGWRETYGIASLALDEASTLQEPRLPALHRDPFDRMLICQAIAHGLVLLTPDEDIARYPVRIAW